MLWKWKEILFFSSLWLWAQASSTSQAHKTPQLFSRDRLVTQAIARVGEHIITFRELEVSFLVERALGWRHPETSPELGLPQKISGALMEWFIFLEAKSFAVATTLTQAEVEKALKRVHKFYKGDSTWASWEVGVRELRKMVEKKLAVRKFIHFKTSSYLISVTNEEAFSYYQRNRSRFGNLAFKTFQESIKKIFNPEGI